MGIDLLQECRDGFLIDPNSAHKPSTQKQQRKSKSKRKKKDSEHSINAENVPNTAPQMTFTSTGPQASKTFNNPFDTTHRPNLPFSPTTAPSQNPFLNNSFNFLGQSSLPHHQSAYYPSFTNQNYPWPAPIPQPPDFTAWNQQQNIGWHSGRSPHAYEIVLLQPNVKKCYGCEAEFVERFRHPPNNLIVKHLDKRVTGKSSDGQLVYRTDFSNTYYHPSSLHIKRKNPTFNGIVLIDNALFNSLDLQQRQVMSTYDFRTIFKS